MLVLLSRPRMMSLKMPLSLSRAVRTAPLRRSLSTVHDIPLPVSKAAAPSPLQEAVNANAPRTTWSRDEIKQIYDTPLNQLTYAAVGQDRYSAKLSRLTPPRPPSTAASTTPPRSKCARS